MNTDFSAEIIADSKNKFGQRLTTFMVTFPRMILAEMNTHRMFSRNSASSRAIPFETMLKRVKENPFIPIKWMKDHSGMQGDEYLTGLDAELAEDLWMSSCRQACNGAKLMSERGVTKQFCNRLLEPFMWHTVIITASEWENFFALRVHGAAEIHMQKIAGMMLDEYNASTPKQLKAGEWHIPFGDKMDGEKLEELYGDGYMPPNSEIEKAKMKIAVARCARLSYLNYEGKDDYEADIKLHDRLSKMGHMSPFEHVAKAMSKYDMEVFLSGQAQWTDFENSENYLYTKDIEGWCGNYRGFIQHRKTFENENRTDDRVKKQS